MTEELVLTLWTELKKYMGNQSYLIKEIAFDSLIISIREFFTRFFGNELLVLDDLTSKSIEYHY